MQGESPRVHAAEPRKAGLGVSPEGLNAVDVDLAADEFVAAVVDADMGVAEVPEVVVAAPTVGVDDGGGFDAFQDYPLQ